MAKKFLEKTVRVNIQRKFAIAGSLCHIKFISMVSM